MAVSCIQGFVHGPSSFVRCTRGKASDSFLVDILSIDYCPRLLDAFTSISWIANSGF